METIKSPGDLRKLRERVLESVNPKEERANEKVRIRVHSGTSGLASGSKEIYDFLVHELSKRNIEAVIVSTGDMGYCYAEPTIEVTLPGCKPVVFGYVDKVRADEIIEKYIKNRELTEGILPVNYQTI